MSESSAVQSLVSAETSYSLLIASLALLKDISLFLHERVISLLPEKYSIEYYNLLSKITAALSPAFLNLVRVSEPYLTQASLAISKFWALVEAKTSPFVNQWVLDFERRYPGQAGKIGASLLDKVVLLVVLWAMVTCAIRMSRRVILGSSRSLKVGKFLSEGVSHKVHL